ncbi:MAG: GNAT family N-acetyltransferase [archaeon]
MKVLPLESERLVIRQFAKEEAHLLASLASDRNLIFGDMSYPYTLQHAKDWLRISEVRDDMYYYAIVEKKTDRIVGNIWISHVRNDRTVDDGCLSYGLCAEARGKGYATEAVRRIIEFAFSEMKLDKLRAETKGTNLASHNVLSKLGFSCVKKIKDFQRDRFTNKSEDKWFWELKNEDKNSKKI